MRTLKPGNAGSTCGSSRSPVKPIPVHKGEILRIKQIEGGQCVDFNCFNLNDHKEYMSVGHMRREGFRTAQDRFIWSNPPRYRPMMKILTCRLPA